MSYCDKNFQLDEIIHYENEKEGISFDCCCLSLWTNNLSHNLIGVQLRRGEERGGGGGGMESHHFFFLLKPG